jgi:hypothetical protein
VRRSIGVTRPGLVHALLAQPAPAGWRASSLLRHRRPVVFDDGHARTDEHDLVLDPELGLVLS